MQRAIRNLLIHLWTDLDERGKASEAGNGSGNTGSKLVGAAAQQRRKCFVLPQQIGFEVDGVTDSRCQVQNLSKVAVVRFVVSHGATHNGGHAQRSSWKEMGRRRKEGGGGMKDGE